MLSLIKLLFLFNGLIFISGFCPDTPVVQTSSINSTNATVITNATAGMTTFPTTSTKQLEIFANIKIQETCTGASPATKSLLSITVTTTDSSTNTKTENELLRLFIDCTNLKVDTSGVWATPLGTTTSRSAVTSATDIKDESLSIFLALDLANNFYSVEYLSKSYHDAHLITMSASQTYSFDATTKIYLCAAKAGTLQNSCLASGVKVGYSSLGALSSPATGYVGGSTPALVSFYPFNGTLSNANTANTVPDAYFGSAAASPTAGTAPSWDNSSTFIKASTLGQYLSVPLSGLSSADGTTTGVTLKTLAIAAWVRIASLPAKSTTSTILSMHATDLTELGFKLVVSQTSPYTLSLLTGSAAIAISGTAPTITLNAWTLVGFSVVVSSDGKNYFGTFFANSTFVQFDVRASATAVTLSTATLLRVSSANADNALVADISVVRVASPAAGYLKVAGERCSTTNNKVELGSGLFALTCADTYKLSVLDSKCYSTCPAGTIASNATVNPLCLVCPGGCATCDSTGCLSCPNVTALYQKTCIASCPSGTYEDSNNTCISCKVANCDQCDANQCIKCNTLLGYLPGTVNGRCLHASEVPPDPKAGTGPGVAGVVCAGLILIGYLIYAYNSEENLSMNRQGGGFKSVANYQN